MGPKKEDRQYQKEPTAITLPDIGAQWYLRLQVLGATVNQGIYLMYCTNTKRDEISLS